MQGWAKAIAEKNTTEGEGTHSPPCEFKDTEDAVLYGGSSVQRHGPGAARQPHRAWTPD